MQKMSMFFYKESKMFYDSTGSPSYYFREEDFQDLD